MRLLRCFVGTEWRLQWRSLRFRFAAAAYGLICGLPSAVIFFAVRGRTEDLLGANAYLAETLKVQPFLTVVVAALLSGNRSGQQALAESWCPLAAAEVSNASYVLRRYLAILTLLLPLTALPQAVAAGFALAAGSPIVHPETWVWSWLVLIVPQALAISAIWLAVVMITGGEMAAAVLCVAGAGLGQTALNEVLLRFQMTVGGAGDWLGANRLKSWLRWTAWWFDPGGRHDQRFVATEAPYDVAAALEWLVPRTVLVAAIAVFALALATAFVHRTRRDLKPLEVRADHPLRTYLKMWNGLRQRHAPDAALGLAERLAMAVGLLTVVAALAFLINRQLGYRRMAEERYQVLVESRFEPLPVTVRPLDWRIEGRIGEHGKLELEVRGRLRNQGEESQAQLAFTVNAGLRLDPVTVPGRQIETQRAWDRLLVTLEPPLAAAEEVELKFRLTGVPSDPHFGLRSSRTSFVRAFQHLASARFPRDLTDLSLTRIRPAVDRRRIVLRSGDLGPVPRYTTWELTPPSTTPGEPGQQVPSELTHFGADLTVDLEAPAKWFLADSCGHSSLTASTAEGWSHRFHRGGLGRSSSRRQSGRSHHGGRSRLHGTCRTALDEFEVRGGELVELRDASEGAVVAALAAHRQRAQELLPSLSRTGALSERAWPGLEGLSDLVVVEWPPAFDVDLQRGMTGRRSRTRQELVGKLLLISESSFVGSEPLRAEDLVAGILTRSLMERRELVTEQVPHFRSLFEALMIRRMGLAGDRVTGAEGATVSGPLWHSFQLRMPILDANPLYHDVVFRKRLPAVMVEVESRIGSHALYAGIESFLSRDSVEPATMRQLFAELEAQSGVSLERMFEDYFEGDGLPMLRLEEVRSVRIQDRWRVEGKVRNTGTGEVVCPVVIEAGNDQIHQTVTVDSMSATPFSVVTASRPHTVLLDPQRTCHRRLLRASPTLERVHLEN